MVKINKKAAVKNPKDFFGTLFSFSIKGKKGMEMSLNLIIMLIIGMVVLGLVIGFVNSLVNKGTDSFNKELAKNEQAELEQIKLCSENLCISPYPTLTIKKGNDNPVYIKVRGYDGEIECAAGSQIYGADNCVKGSLILTIVNDDGTQVSGTDPFSLRGQRIMVAAGEEDAQRFVLTTTLNPGTYFGVLALKTEDTNSEEVSKAITIIVE